MKYIRTTEFDGEEWTVDEHGHRQRRVHTWYINSDEPMPTYEDGAREPDKLIMKDTGAVYIFDEKTMSWCEV